MRRIFDTRWPWEIPLREFIDGPPKATGGYVTLYHGTYPQHIDSIRRTGLDPRKTQDPTLWASRDYEKSDYPVLVIFQVPKDDPRMEVRHQGAGHVTVSRPIEPKDILGIYSNEWPLPDDVEEGSLKPGGLRQRSDHIRFQNGPRNHRMYVEAALEGGFKVPPRVLRDYPDLAGKQEKESNMSDRPLREQVIRLAHAKPELRGDLLPLLQKEAFSGSFTVRDLIKGLEKHDPNRTVLAVAFPPEDDPEPDWKHPILVEVTDVVRNGSAAQLITEGTYTEPITIGQLIAKLNSEFAYGMGVILWLKSERALIDVWEVGGINGPSVSLYAAFNYGDLPKSRRGSYAQTYHVILSGEIETPRGKSEAVLDVEVDVEETRGNNYEVTEIGWSDAEGDWHEGSLRDFLRFTGLRERDIRERIEDEWVTMAEDRDARNVR